MRVVFLGSGTFSLPSLDALLQSQHQVACLVTQPDREKGRGRAVQPPPIKVRAEAHGIPVRQPRRIREDLEALRELAPDVLVVVSYGQILPKGLLEIPGRGGINVHASLLPRYRGAAPVPWAIIRGEERTGVTTMQMDAGLDTGDVLLQQATPIGSDETAGVLLDRLAPLGAELLIETLAALERGSLIARPQDPEKATLAPLLRKEDGRLSWDEGAALIARKIRGLQPWPGTWARHQGKDVKILRARKGGSTSEALGTVVAVNEEGLSVACGGGTLLEVLEVQPESRRPMKAADFARGARLSPGGRLE